MNCEFNVFDVFVVVWLLGFEGGGIVDVFVVDVDGDVCYDFIGWLFYFWLQCVDQIVFNFYDEGYDLLFVFGYGFFYVELGESLGVLSEEDGLLDVVFGDSIVLM